MRKYKLDQEEQDILDALNDQKIKPLKNSKAELAKLQVAAKAYGNKVHRINIRLTQWDYEKAQEKALREGVPYTTFIAGVVHKFLSGQLILGSNSA